MGRQQYIVYISLTTHFNPEDGCSTVSETFVSIRHTTQHNNPYDVDVCSFTGLVSGD
jgi:hypothetical protein